jgi:hypothetical protein
MADSESVVVSQDAALNQDGAGGGDALNLLLDTPLNVLGHAGSFNSPEDLDLESQQKYRVLSLLRDFLSAFLHLFASKNHSSTRE